MPIRRGDLLVSREWRLLGAEYYVGATATSWSDLASSGDERPPFAQLIALATMAWDHESRVFVAIDAPETLSLPTAPEHGPPVEVAASDAARVEWGSAFSLDAVRYAEILRIEGSGPCTEPPEWRIDGVGVRASGASESALNTAYASRNAIDGDPATEWIAPDGTTGVLELSLDPPIEIERLTLVNARNLPYRDRATGTYRLSVVDEYGRTHREEGDFGGFRDRPTERSHALGYAVRCVRITPTSFSGLSAGIAEVRWR